MKTYLVVFNGHYLEGSILVVDETRRKAFNQVIKSLKRMGLYEKNEDLKASDLEEIDTTVEQFEVISNGDY